MQPTSPQSQLRGLPGVGAKPAPALVSAFASFVLADIKGGAYKAAYRLDQVKHALQQALQGNFTPVCEAVTASQGKRLLCLAYQAGWTAIGASADTKITEVRKVLFEGKLSAKENAPAREAIANRTNELFSVFTVAFNKVHSDAKADADAAKAAKVTAKAATPTQESVQEAPPSVAGLVVTEHDAPALDEQYSTVLTALYMGTLSNEQEQELFAAVAKLQRERKAAVKASAQAVHDAYDQPTLTQ